MVLNQTRYVFMLFTV